MRRIIHIALVVVVAAAVAAGCKKSGSSPDPEPSPTPPSGMDERQACTSDADCAVVEIACCDHCNGGTVVGVHRDAAAEVRAQYAGEAKCKDTMCTMMACSPATAVCRQERCGISIEGNEQFTPLPAPEPAAAP
jgi:hypothetical protein